MDALLAHLEEVAGQTRAHVREALDGGRIRAADDDTILRAMTLAAEVQRLADAVLVETVGEVARRSGQRARELRLTSRRGCHDVGGLAQRVTLLASASVARLQRAARATMVREALDGSALPALLPALRGALLEGAVGLDGLLAAAQPLDAMSRHVARDDVLAADAALAAEARGEGPDAAPAACADLLRVHAQAWAVCLDQDGAEPREERALRLRGIALGRPRDGLVPISGALLAETAVQLTRICDAMGSPRVGLDGPVAFRPSAPDEDARSDDAAPAPDDRTPAQKRHDALATALTVAASSRLLPTIGGAAPTLVVSVRAQDLE